MVYSQDKIIKKDGETVEVKIELIDQITIKYKNFNNLSGPDYIIDKSEVQRIEYENGSTETFEIFSGVKKLSKAELKDSIVKLINAHAFYRRSYTHRYIANFEEDFLRLRLQDKKGNLSFRTILYDLSNVYEFHDISKRIDKAYLNIFLRTSKDPKNKKWKGEKLVIRMDNSKAAEALLEFLKEYNSILPISP